MKRLIILIGILVSQPLFAEETESITRAWDFGIGIGYGEQSNPFIAADDVPGYATLDLAIYGEKFFFDNGDLGFTLVDEEDFGLNVFVNYSSERVYYAYFNDLAFFRTSNVIGGPNDTLAIYPLEEVIAIGSSSGQPGIFSVLRLPDRDFAVNLGVEVLWDVPFGQFQWQLTQDVSGSHKGAQMDLDFSRGWTKGRWGIKPSIGLSWKSAKLIDYYYGLDDQSELFDFLNYEGSATIHMNVGLLLSYRINNRLSYVNQYKHTWLGSGVRNSPLIDEFETQSYFSGLFYRF